MAISSALLAAASGLGLGLSLIVAIGAQNAFVIRQGVRGRHVGAVVAVCAGSDVLLIAAGVGGLGVVVTAAPVVLTVARYAGAAFLVGYGVLAVRRLLRSAALVTEPGVGGTLGAAVATCLALTWLNPHVYLDTVLLMGSVASGYAHPANWFLGIGAMLGSLIWFTALGYGARRLAPMFARPLAWRILDGTIALIMFALAIGLVFGD